MAARDDLEDIANRVAIGARAQRSFGSEAADDDGDTIRLYFCPTCEHRGAFNSEDDAWAHALDAHNVVALPTSDAILALDVPLPADD